MLAALILSLTVAGGTSPAVQKLLDSLQAPDSWRRDSVQLELGALDAVQIRELIRASTQVAPHGRLALIELLATPGKHLGGVVLACADADQAASTLAADVVERVGMWLQHRRALDGIEEEIERRSHRIFAATGLVLGCSAGARAVSLSVLVDQLDRFARPIRPIVIDPQLAATWRHALELELAPEPAEVMGSRLARAMHADLQRWPSAFALTPAAIAPARGGVGDRTSGAQQLARERAFIRSLAEDLRMRTDATLRCASVMALVRLGVFGIGTGLLPIVIDASGDAADRELAIDAVAAAASLPTGESLDGSAPVMMAQLERATDELERYLLVEGLCRLSPAVIEPLFDLQPRWLTRADCMHVVGRLRLRSIVERAAAAAGDARWAFEVCRAAARVGTPAAPALRALISQALVLPEAARELARYPWSQELTSQAWLREDAVARELWYELHGGSEVLRVIEDQALPLHQRLRVARHASLDAGVAATLPTTATARTDVALLTLALRARGCSQVGTEPRMSAAERNALMTALRQTDLNALDLADLVADLQHPQGTDLVADLLQGEPSAMMIARGRLAIERLALRFVLAGDQRLGALKRRLEALPATETFASLRELKSGTIWEYELAEDAGRALMLLDELESYAP